MERKIREIFPEKLKNCLQWAGENDRIGIRSGLFTEKVGLIACIFCIRVDLTNVSLNPDRFERRDFNEG